MADVRALCDRFEIAIPDDYRSFPCGDPASDGGVGAVAGGGRRAAQHLEPDTGLPGVVALGAPAVAQDIDEEQAAAAGAEWIPRLHARALDGARVGDRDADRVAPDDERDQDFRYSVAIGVDQTVGDQFAREEQQVTLLVEAEFAVEVAGELTSRARGRGVVAVEDRLPRRRRGRPRRRNALHG